MTRKILNKADPNIAGKFSGIDADYINKLLTGIDQSGTDPVDINTTWKFRTQKMQIGEPVASGSELYNIYGSAITSDYNVTLPLLTANDTFMMTESTQTMTYKTIPGGSAATVGSNNLLSDFVLYPTHIKVGGYFGGSSTTGFGTASGTTATVGTSSFNVDTTGKFTNWATTTTANAQAGFRTGNAVTMTRSNNPRLVCKFRLNNTSNVRFGIYFSSAATAFPTAGSDDPLSTSVGFGLIKRSTDTTNFQIGHRVTGSASYDASGIEINTNTHILQIQADETNSGFKWSWDNGVWSNVVTTNVPASTSTLRYGVYVETSDTNAKNFDLYWLVVENLEVPSF